ncbi:hypothetical protein EDD22DRAFT_906207 [Suillus occidentalis]|nr:hypothetical protein EDD22DRAFT_906207 [Suillus occidentalis]
MPSPPSQMAAASNLQVGTTNSQRYGDVVKTDQRDESSSDDGSEYDPNSCDSHSVVESPRKYHPGQNTMKLDRHQRALVRALSKRTKWDAKEIAAVFRVSLVIIQKTISNAYVAVNDIVSEDENYYKESEFEKLIMKRPSPKRTQEKKKGRKKQNTMSAKRFTREAAPVPHRQPLTTRPATSVPSEQNSDATSGLFRMFRDEAMLVHGEKVHSILEEIGIEDDETMFAVLTMDDERLHGMLQEAKRLNLVEKFSVIQAMRNFGKNHKIAK